MQDYDTMELDWYKILGVDPSADREAIHRAYRKRATECHPDHGGSHRDMVEVTAAWDILRDPERRARFDESRTGASPVTAQAAARDVERAREWAEQYPRRWDEFETWLDRVARDFGNAKYTPTVMGGGALRGVPFPVASDSWSGTAFTCFGGAIGALIGLALWYSFPILPIRATILCFMGLVSVGGWVGMIVHKGIGRTIAPVPKEKSKQRCQEPTGTVTVHCPGCQQKLRLPRIAKFLAVTCPACRHQFDLPPAF